MIPFLIYITGYFICYWLVKKTRAGDDWSEVFFTIGFSIFSWLAVLGLGIVFIILKIKEKNIKPPRWM